MRIPEIQARFRELAKVIAKGGGTLEIAAEIETLVDELSRRAAVTRAPVQSKCDNCNETVWICEEMGI